LTLLLLSVTEGLGLGFGAPVDFRLECFLAFVLFPVFFAMQCCFRLLGGRSGSEVEPCNASLLRVQEILSPKYANKEKESCLIQTLLFFVVLLLAGVTLY